MKNLTIAEMNNLPDRDAVAARFVELLDDAGRKAAAAGPTRPASSPTSGGPGK